MYRAIRQDEEAEIRQQVHPDQILETIRAWNEEAEQNGWPTIRFVIFNSCESDAHAELLSLRVDFVIGIEDFWPMT